MRRISAFKGFCKTDAGKTGKSQEFSSLVHGLPTSKLDLPCVFALQQGLAFPEPSNLAVARA